MEERKGLRAVPPVLLLGIGLWIAMMIVRVVHLMVATDIYGSLRMGLVTEGTTFAGYVLATLGMFDLARRLTGREAFGVKLAAMGFACVLAIDVSYTATSFIEDLYDHRWIFDVYDYAFFVPWFGIVIALAWALWPTSRGGAVVLAVIGFVTGPPRFIGEEMFGWLDLGSKQAWAFDIAMRVLRLAAVLWALIALAKGTPQSNRVLAAEGMRGAAKALWLRLIAAVSVAVLTMIVVTGKGSAGALEVLKLATLSAAVLNIIAFVMFGLGALRGARAELAELPRWPLLAGGATSLWAAGVMLGQLPWIYKMFYGSRFGAGDMFADYAQTLSLALPLVVIAGVLLVAVAIGLFGSRSGNLDLTAQAQSKGAGFGALALVAIAITTWMVPKASSPGSFAMLSLLAAGAGFAGFAMMASLCAKTAAVLEGEPSLPTAKVVDP